MRFYLPLLVLLTGCSLFRPRPIVVSPQTGPAAAHAGALDASAQSKAAAAAVAAQRANEANPEGTPKEATAGELGLVVANLPAPKAEDLATAVARVETALRGDLTEARKQWAAAQSEAQLLRQKLVNADAAAERERLASVASLEKLKTDFAAQLDEQKREAEAEQQRLIGWIFYGGGSVLILLGIGCVTLLSSVPFAGPKLAASLVAAGFAAIACGRAVAWMLAHPWVIAVVILVPIAFAAALALANHYHDAITKKLTSIGV